MFIYLQELKRITIKLKVKIDVSFYCSFVTFTSKTF